MTNVQYAQSKMEFMKNHYNHTNTKAADETLNAILDLIVEGVWDWSSATGYVTRSAGWYHMLGYEVNCFKNDVFTWENIIHPDDYHKVMQHFEAYITGKIAHYQIEYRCKKSDNSYLWIVDRAVIVEHNQDGNVARMIGAHHNIDKRKHIELEYERQYQLLRDGNLSLEALMNKKVEELEAKNVELSNKLTELESISNIDLLTKIANRKHFENELTKEVLRANRYRQPLSLVIFDIDYFKKINDTHGHKLGDSILCHLSELVSANIRDVDLLARWGGDEFVIILPELCKKKAHKACDKLKALINRNATCQRLSVTCSFGVSEYQLGEPLDELFQRVDQLLFSSKDKGRNTVQS